jgi:predicted enzyme related to lactoylglutathione lyase
MPSADAAVGARLSGVVLECPDPSALATFYSQLTGWTNEYSDADWASIGPDADTRPRLAFQLAPGYQPPRWPDPASPMQFHLDFMVDDLDDAEKAALAIGARKFDEQPDPTRFRVFADPVGHPFCLCVD